MCKQYAGGLIAAHTEVAALGPSAFPGLADLHPVEAVVSLANGLPVGTVAAGIAVHHGADAGVGVFYRVEKQAVHGVILTLSAI